MKFSKTFIFISGVFFLSFSTQSIKGESLKQDEDLVLMVMKKTSQGEYTPLMVVHDTGDNPHKIEHAQKHAATLLQGLNEGEMDKKGYRLPPQALDMSRNSFQEKTKEDLQTWLPVKTKLGVSVGAALSSLQNKIDRVHKAQDVPHEIFKAGRNMIDHVKAFYFTGEKQKR